MYETARERMVDVMLEQKEMDRVRMNLMINEVQKNMDELNQYYQLTKLGNTDNMALLLKKIDELSKRVDELEKKTA